MDRHPLFLLFLAVVDDLDLATNSWDHRNSKAQKHVESDHFYAKVFAGNCDWWNMEISAVDAVHFAIRPTRYPLI